MQQGVSRNLGRSGSRTGSSPLAAVAAGCLSTVLAMVEPAAAETIAPVFQQALPNPAGKTMSVVTVDFAPASRAVPHRHGQAFLFAYVLQGTIRSQLEGQPPQTYAAGQSWPEPPGSHHVLTENLSATEPARLLVVFIADPGAALKVDDAPAGAK